MEGRHPLAACNALAPHEAPLSPSAPFSVERRLKNLITDEHLDCGVFQEVGGHMVAFLFCRAVHPRLQPEVTSALVDAQRLLLPNAECAGRQQPAADRGHQVRVEGLPTRLRVWGVGRWVGGGTNRPLTVGLVALSNSLTFACLALALPLALPSPSPLPHPAIMSASTACCPACPSFA